MDREQLDLLHPEYKRLLYMWKYAADHYSATEVLQKEHIYLPKMQQGEADTAYMERKKFMDYTPYFSTIVDELAGMLDSLAREPISRVWGDVLGDVAKNNNPSHLLSQNADGMGQGWDTLFTSNVANLITYQNLWVLVDGVVKDKEQETVKDPSVRILQPETVTNWRYERGKLVEVLVKEAIDGRTNLLDEYKEHTAYLHYTLNGWTRYVVDENDDITRTEEGQYAYYADARKTNRILPIFRVELPLRRYVAYILAKKCNAILNLESNRDFLLYTANRPRLLFDSDSDKVEDLVKRMKEGFNYLIGVGHKYIAPDTAPAELAGIVIKEKTESLYRTAFQQYSDQAKQKTATEIVQQNSGNEAFLTLLATVMDDAETKAGRLLEQVHSPENSGNWGGFTVQRTRQYRAIDEVTFMQSIQDRFFGGKNIPVGKVALTKLAERSLEGLGVTADTDELEAEIDQFIASNAQSNQLDKEFNL